MKIDKRFIIGFLTVLILSSGVVYVNLQGENVKFRIDNDKNTLYIINEDTSRWIVAGREYNRLYDGSSLMNRDRTGIYIETNEDNLDVEDDFVVMRVTPYQRGATIIDTIFFKGDVQDKVWFPYKHKVEIINGYSSGATRYRYTIDDIYVNTGRYDFNGELEAQFGKLKVVLNKGYIWAKAGWPYGEDSISAQYLIDSDYEVFEFRMFDPDPKQNVTDNIGH